MKTTFTQWNNFGDHPLVTKETSQEFEYQEALDEGYGFINSFTIVRPGSYIVEVNDIFVAVISEAKYQKIIEKE